ncbi:MAG TPA: AI-2E family transporter [Candidatus Nanoarchaeia archaeon]|nr:AI-2E family transporter [Candidatus Nanoarchaeia archaeon]
MLSETSVKQIITGVLIIILLIFAFLIIKPLFLAILFGLILAYTFYPIYSFLLKYIKSRTISALITCAVVIALLIIILWFSVPLLIEQIFQSYITIQSFDTLGFLKRVFPPLFSSPQVSANFAAVYTNFLSSSANNALTKISTLLIDLPSLALKLLVVLITFFYGLRDGKKIIDILKDTLPFNRATTNKFIQKSEQITFSVVYGRVVIGIITGTLAGIGYYFAGFDNAILLSVITMFVSIIPLIGPWIVWAPLVIGLFFAGSIGSAIFLLIYCLLVVTLFENLATPLVVSKRSNIPTSLTLIALIGGILVFGIFGIILGPLIIAYLIILFEIYREYSVKKE